MAPAPPPSSAPALSYRAEAGRKALHLLALALPAGVWWMGAPAGRWVLGTVALVALACDVLRARWAAFERAITRPFGWMMRAEERPPVPGPVAINGATWVVVALFLLVVAFPLAAALPAFAAFMTGDAAAALVGRRWGRHRWPGTRRTIEGSAAFLFVALAVLAALRVPLGPALACAATSALAEALPIPFNDNLRVPFAGALVLFLLLP